MGWRCRDRIVRLKVQGMAIRSQEKWSLTAAGRQRSDFRTARALLYWSSRRGAEITAAEAEKEGYSTAYDTGDGGFQNGNETEPLTITNTGSVSVKFVNTYEPVSGFSFQKTDAQDRGLGGRGSLCMSWCVRTVNINTLTICS